MLFISTRPASSAKLCGCSAVLLYVAEIMALIALWHPQVVPGPRRAVPNEEPLGLEELVSYVRMNFDHPMTVGHSWSNPEFYFESVFEFMQWHLLAVILFMEGGHEDVIILCLIRVVQYHERIQRRLLGYFFEDIF